MNRQQKIAALLKANAGWAESDTEFLTALSDTDFDRIAGTVQMLTAAQGSIAALQSDVAVLKANTKTAPKDAAEYIAQAPAEIQPMLKSMQELHDQYRTQLIAGVKLNSANTFSDEELKAMSDATLTKVAELSGLGKEAIAANFSGRSVAAPAPKANSDEERIKNNMAPPVPDFPRKS
jgi:hypothetical protein